MKGVVSVRFLASLMMFFFFFFFCSSTCNGAIQRSTSKRIRKLNKQGPYLGIVVPNAFEMGPLLQSPSFAQDNDLPYLDYGGRRFRFGTLERKKVIIVMTGVSMLNAGTTTQLLLSLFEVEGVLHLGIAGNADPNLQIGDVTIPKYWAHLGLWYWQRYGQDKNEELSQDGDRSSRSQTNEDYTREIGYLKFSDYSNGTVRDNLLNRVWYQPEEIFPVTGVPEVRQHAFWVPVDSNYFEISKKLVGIQLERCANATTCLPRLPKVTAVDRGCSANTFIDNAAYRGFLRAKFNVTPIDMESAAVALVCLQQSTPFIAMRSLSDLAGGGSAESNEANVYAPLAAQNAATALVSFTSLLSAM